MVSPIFCGLLVPQSQLKKNILKAFCTKCESHTLRRGRTLAWGAARQGVTGAAGILQGVAGLTGVLLPGHPAPECALSRSNFLEGVFFGTMMQLRGSFLTQRLSS